MSLIGGRAAGRLHDSVPVLTWLPLLFGSGPKVVLKKPVRTGAAEALPGEAKWGEAKRFDPAFPIHTIRLSLCLSPRRAWPLWRRDGLGRVKLQIP